MSDPTCDLNELFTHHLKEFVIDPGSNQFSASRAMLIWANILGTAGAMIMIVCGVIWNMSWCGIPAATIFTGLVASNASVYYASTRKEYRCNHDHD
jgi:hypothetical protein